ncbi:MAG: hypothetical protein J6T40_08185 [Clostridiales bacterium]|nr:hypothetical protein [Clostridiales bacterium]
MTDKPEKSPRFVSSGLIVDLLLSISTAITLTSLESISLYYLSIANIYYSHLISTTIVCAAFVLIRRLRIPQVLMIGLHFVAGGIYLYLLYYFNMRFHKYPTASVICISFCVFFLFIHSMLHRYAHRSKHVAFDTLIVTLSIHAVILIGFIVMQSPYGAFYTLLNAIFIVILYCVARQIDVFETRYYHNLHSSTQPVRAIRTQNIYSIFLIFGGIGIALALLLVIPVDQIARLLQKFAYVIFGLIGKFLEWINSGGTTADPEDELDWTDLLNKLQAEETDQSEPSAFSVILTTIIFGILFLLMFVFLIKTIILIMKHFHHEQGEEKVVENDAVIDIIEEVPKTKLAPSLSRQDFGEGYEGKIRKQYYQRVARAMRKGMKVKPSTSPREIEEEIKNQGDPSISELTSLYESVRYNKRQD